jgi:hypothetical protein
LRALCCSCLCLFELLSQLQDKPFFVLELRDIREPKLLLTLHVYCVCVFVCVCVCLCVCVCVCV